MTIYERIKERRTELGMSQQQLAEKVGYQSGSAINKIEKGQRDINTAQVMAFARALGVSAFWLMGIEVQEKSELHGLCEKLNKKQQEEAASYISYILWRDRNEV